MKLSFILGTTLVAATAGALTCGDSPSTHSPQPIPSKPNETVKPFSKPESASASISRIRPLDERGEVDRAFIDKLIEKGLTENQLIANVQSLHPPEDGIRLLVEKGWKLIEQQKGFVTYALPSPMDPNVQQEVTFFIDGNQTILKSMVASFPEERDVRVYLTQLFRMDANGSISQPLVSSEERIIVNNR